MACGWGEGGGGQGRVVGNTPELAEGLVDRKDANAPMQGCLL